MYKNGGVGQVQPAAEQRNTKRWRTEIKTCDVQPDSDPDGQQETLWLSSSDRPRTSLEAGSIRFMLFLFVDAERFWILGVFRILEGWSESTSSGGTKRTQDEATHVRLYADEMNGKGAAHVLRLDL